MVKEYYLEITKDFNDLMGPLSHGTPYAEFEISGG